ncbi:ATP synthase subunit gamma, mitochondrial [Strongylocentrotus purpuratus]|uniref:ATP synthase subunit gamma, mitochondrial n=1 Tax=Strongylocentrotus purpuratus TaxID=7668 RepID=A0A7M7RE85_STRPU|nr:ATP synthase subunit gamma, mitochondrial [Strongylocentrotus purpuratus]|eukprot:XP_784312.1 PREDICTED: ATP synthase subunit gamma, mitochondrial [Strongylocentrotus purpuratus]
MATLKLLANRIKSVTNIQKITKSMKMIAAARYTKAERELKSARSYGVGATALYEKAEIEPPMEKENHLVIALSSDRGLCGGIHSNVTKAVKAYILEQGDNANIKIGVIGDKARLQLQRTHRDNILFAVNDYGRKPPSFTEASMVASAILDSGYEFDTAEVIFNNFRSVVAYNTKRQPVIPFDTLSTAEKMSVYDDIDADILRNYSEFQLASVLYTCMMDANCSEQSSRMTAMDNATKNAGEMIDKLTLKYNRTRQAVITRELVEIISGASALE